MITGLRPATFENLQLNAGVFLKNFNHSDTSDADALETAVLAALSAGTGVIGATVGGGTFQCTPTLRQIEADGKRCEFKGSTVNDGWTVKLTGTMKEITPASFADALMCATVTTSGRKTTIKIRSDIELSDYIDTLCWIGDTSKGMVLIELENALNLTGANFTFTDKGEGSLPFEFQAHQDSLVNMEYAPCSIVFFDNATVASAISVYSVEGTSSGKTQITVTPQASGTQSYKYKTGTAVSLPAANDALTTGWTTWDGSAEITATAGNQIVVAIVTTADNKCQAAGRTAVVSMT